MGREIEVEGEVEIVCPHCGKLSSHYISLTTELEPPDRDWRD